MVKPKVNPKSLKNLMHEGRPTVYDQKKTTHNITVTPTGWEGIQATAQSLGYSGVSEFIEQVGRGQVCVEKKPVESSKNNSQTNITYEDMETLLENYLQAHELSSRKSLKNFLEDLLEDKFKQFIRAFTFQQQASSNPPQQ